MNDKTITVTVAKDLEDLIPTFMTNRNKELETLRTALGAGDMEQLRQLGHRMKGVGNSYGFELISVLGKQIEDGAKVKDIPGLESRITEYTDYLARVTIVYE
jgi:HPt (histidine-containing phosphotransfer) domain-containing protein